MKSVTVCRCYILLVMMSLFSVAAIASDVAKPPSANKTALVPKADKSKWKKLSEDGLHDPSNPKLSLMQNPGDALSLLPYDDEGNIRSMVVGNQVKWIQALREGYINPRKSFEGKNDDQMKVLDLNIMLTKRNTGEMPRVLFPHRPHTEWLDCSNCHDWLFKAKAGANKISMFAILEGEFCGRCHGAVAFPLTQCQRCHSQPFDRDVPMVSQPREIKQGD